MATPTYRNRAEIWARDRSVGLALDDIWSQFDQASQQQGLNSPGVTSSPPPQITAFSVTAGDGGFYFTITDNNPITRNIEYFVEWSTTADFKQPHVLSLGPSRNGTVWLGNKTLYFRAYSQYSPVSAPSSVVYFGTPVKAVAGGGSLAGPALPQSTGSGTARSDGTQGGSGAGVQPLRGNPVAG